MICGVLAIPQGSDTLAYFIPLFISCKLISMFPLEDSLSGALELRLLGSWFRRSSVTAVRMPRRVPMTLFSGSPARPRWGLSLLVILQVWGS